MIMADLRRSIYVLSIHLLRLHVYVNTLIHQTTESGKICRAQDLENYGRNLIFRGNLNKYDSLKTISVKTIFTRELLKIWSEVNFEDVVKTKEKFLEQSIWHNSLIRIENKPVFNKKLFSLGISKVKDFEKEQYNFLSLTDFIEKCKCQLQPLKYFGLVSALKQLNNSSITQNPTLSIPQDSLLTLFLRNAKETEVVYKKRL